MITIQPQTTSTNLIPTTTNVKIIVVTQQKVKIGDITLPNQKHPQNSHPCPVRVVVAMN
jgi:hypothetical protein